VLLAGVRKGEQMSDVDAFKVCTNCQHVWPDRESFLSDTTLRMEGYQVNFVNLEEGLFLFTHNIESCCSTIAIPAAEFTDLHDGPVFDENLKGEEGCDDSCLHTGVIDSCKAECECAYVRDVLVKVKDWQKHD
jgi:hypothetical protein